MYPGEPTVLASGGRGVLCRQVLIVAPLLIGNHAPVLIGKVDAGWIAKPCGGGRRYRWKSLHVPGDVRLGVRPVLGSLDPKSGASHNQAGNRRCPQETSSDSGNPMIPMSDRVQLWYSTLPGPPPAGSSSSRTVPRRKRDATPVAIAAPAVTTLKVDPGSPLAWIGRFRNASSSGLLGGWRHPAG